jgi:hypothetical protein
MGESFLGLVTQAWATFSSCKPFVTERRLKIILHLPFSRLKTLKMHTWQWGAAGGAQQAVGSGQGVVQDTMWYGLSYEQWKNKIK